MALPSFSHRLVACRQAALWAWCAAALLGSLLAAPAIAQPLPKKGADKAAPERFGRLIAVPLPLTGPAGDRVERMIKSLLNDRALQNMQPVIVLEFRPRGRDAGAGSELGSAFDVVRLLTGRETSRARLIAYVPESIKGHAVLLAMACDEIIMHPEAHLGDAGADETAISPEIRDIYSRIADSRKTIPKAVALKMLDRNLELLEVETETSREFVLREDLDRLRADKAVKAEQRVVSAAGEPAWFTGAEARELGFVSFLAEDRAALTAALDLSRDKLEEDPSLDGSQWRPIAVPLKGPMTAQKVSRAQRLIEDQIQQRDVNLICLWLDSPGGAPAESAKLANYLADLDPGQRRTVAFIPTEARADAAFVALACDQIVMEEGSVLGGVGAVQIEGPEQQVHVQVVREIAERKFRSPSLAAAIIDPNLQVFRYTHPGRDLVEYLSENDAAELPERDQWQRGPEVTEPGKPLQVDPERGKELGIVHEVVHDFSELRDIYHLEGNPQFVEPGWADTLIDTLASPQVAWLLLLIGGAAVYIEAKTPGIGVGGMIGALCFLVFFWARFLGGTAEWLEVLLFLAGIGLLLVELFVLPGFGIFGLMGGLCVISSVILASQTFYIPRNDYQLGQFRDSMVSVAGAGVGIVAAIAALRRFLPHTPLFNQVMLEPPQGTELESIASNEALASFAHLLGMRGAAYTPLAPAGKARFGDQLVDVVSDGEFIERGTEVVVVQARANRVVVKPV